VNDKCLSKSDVWYIFSKVRKHRFCLSVNIFAFYIKILLKWSVIYLFLYFQFGTVACVNGTFDCKKGRVFVSYKEKQGALNALETMLITKEYHLQVTNVSVPSSGTLPVISVIDNFFLPGQRKKSRMLQNLQTCFILIFMIDIEAFCKLACTVRYTRTVVYYHCMFNLILITLQFTIKMHKLTLFCAVGFKEFYSSKERLQHREQGQRKYGVW
jgi:hypothetical protein